MAAKISRTFTKYEVTAYTLNDDVPPTIEKYASIEVTDTSINERKARVAFRDAGVALPKHCVLKWAEVESVMYSMTLDQFIENAEVED